MAARSGLARVSVALVASILALGVGIAPAAEGEGETPSARPAEPKKHYRWGVGWDEGLALRARFANGWGLGLRVNPDLLDPESTDKYTSKSTSEWLCYGTRTCSNQSDRSSNTSSTGDVRTWEGAVMLYHEKKLGKWLAVGPYVAVNYQRRLETNTEDDTTDSTTQYRYPYLIVQPLPQVQHGSSKTATREWQRTLGLELGIRPVFQFHERFLLETRFGLELAFTKWRFSGSRHSETKSTDSSVITTSFTPTSTSGYDVTDEASGSERRLHTVGERLGPGAELRFVVLF